jgi:hypothetical protein
MKKAVIFTNKLTPKLMDWVNSYSKEQGITKRDVIEDALEEYQEKIIKEKMAESFKRAAKDPEMLEIAEEGMDDYFNMLKKYD